VKPEYDRIELVFENCACFKISPDDVLSVYLDKITDSVFINASGQFIREKQCEKFSAHFKAGIIDNLYMGDESLRDHLNIYNDLTGIVIVKGSEELYIHVPYDIENGCSKNIFMTTKYDDNGDIVIEVSS